MPEAIAAPSESLSASTDFAGTYTTCSRPGICTIIEIRPDGTFSFTPGDPVVKWQPLEGRWRETQPGMLLASTNEQPTTAELLATTRRHSRKLKFCVTDHETGAAAPDAWIAFDADGISGYVDTDQRGCVEVPRYRALRRIEVKHCRYDTAAYDLQESSANSFQVRLKRTRPLLREEKWLVQGGKLYVLAKDPLDLQ